MTSFFSDLEEQLRAAAREQTSKARGADAPPPPRRPRRRWLARGARLVPVAAAIAVTLAVVAGALLLLGHRGGQSPAAPAGHASGTSMAAIVRSTPPAQIKREFALMGAATRTVQSSRVCDVATTAPAVVIHVPPGHALLSTLGLLRRPATAADRPPAHALALGVPGLSVYAGAARRALTGAGTATFIVPIRQSPQAGFPSDRCFALQIAAVRRALPSMPRKLRAPTWALTNAFIAYDRSLAAHPPVDAICEITLLSHNGRSTSCGMTVEQIRAGTLPDSENNYFSGLAPDGVASVTLRFPASPGRPMRSATARVHDNVYTVHVPGVPAAETQFPTVIWRAANGKVVRTYSQPAGVNSLTLKQLCARHPRACAPMALASGVTVNRVAAQVRPVSPGKGGG